MMAVSVLLTVGNGWLFDLGGHPGMNIALLVLGVVAWCSTGVVAIVDGMKKAE